MTTTRKRTRGAVSVGRPKREKVVAEASSTAPDSAVLEVETQTTVEATERLVVTAAEGDPVAEAVQAATRAAAALAVESAVSSAEGLESAADVASEATLAEASAPAAAESKESKPPPKKRSPAGENQQHRATENRLKNLDPHNPENFNHFLFELLAFKAETHNFHVTKEEHPQLHSWMQYLKREYKKQAEEGDPSVSGPCVLQPVQLKVLEYLHVPLTSRGDEHWNRFYDLLKKYKDTHGHALVPRLCEVPGLGDWVTDQRRQFKSWKQGQSTQLTQDRREKLDTLGFAWSVRNRPEWEHRFQELLEYKKQHGDCKVPQHYKHNKALGKWVAKQREQWKLLQKGEHSFLTPYRVEKLTQAGFVWQVRQALDTGEEEEGEEGGGDAPSSNNNNNNNAAGEGEEEGELGLRFMEEEDADGAKKKDSSTAKSSDTGTTVKKEGVNPPTEDTAPEEKKEMEPLPPPRVDDDDDDEVDPAKPAPGGDPPALLVTEETADVETTAI